jgi:hypothetical protein
LPRNEQCNGPRQRTMSECGRGGLGDQLVGRQPPKGSRS